jgi:4-hydroxy-tetrahydrodipicolinate synthase
VAAAQGYPVGDVRPPLTTYASLGKEGETRVKKVMAVIREMDKLMDRLDGKRPIAAE